MIFYNSTQAKGANKSFDDIIKHLFNTCNVLSPEDTGMRQSHLRKLTIYLDTDHYKTVVLEGHEVNPGHLTKEVIQVQ